MRLIRCSFFITLSIWAAVSCKQSAPDVAPTALDSVGVVSTFVSAKAMLVNGKQARITGLAVDSAGNVYAADQANYVVRKISPAGVVTTLAGSGQAGYQNGPAATAKFGQITSLAIDRRGNLFVGEASDNSCIRKISPEGQVSTLAGKPFNVFAYPFYPETSADGRDTSARFITVTTLTFDASGNLYAGDGGSVNNYSHNAIRKITPDGLVKTLVGTVSGLPFQGRIVGNTSYPRYYAGLAANRAGGLAAVDLGSRAVFQITPTGDISELFPYVDANTPRILLYEPDGSLLMANTSKIWRVTPGGAPRVLAGSDDAGFANDSLRLARFSSIAALATDVKRLLYIADQNNGSIRRVRLN